jgi:hypothetical protein
MDFAVSDHADNKEGLSVGFITVVATYRCLRSMDYNARPLLTRLTTSIWSPSPVRVA